MVRRRFRKAENSVRFRVRAPSWMQPGLHGKRVLVLFFASSHRAHRLAARIPALHAEYAGSNPAGLTDSCTESLCASTS